VPLRPVDWLMALYNVVMIAVWLPLAATEPAARWLLAPHVAALAVPLLLASAREPLSRFGALVRGAYPLAWLSAFWGELNVHALLVGSGANDAVLAAAERFVFGGCLCQAWQPAMHGLAFSEVMEGFYFSYYLLMIGVPIWSFLRARGRQASADVVLRLSLAYIVSFVVFAAVPTAGPMHMYPRFVGENAHGIFRLMNDFLRASGDAAGTGFPSSHVTGSIGLAWIAWRHLPRPAAWIAAVVAAGIVPATVYTQNHFVLDSLAGVFLGVTVQASLDPALRRLRAWRPRLPLLRMLPRTEPEAA
jgi:membrane-associated phospholipid phosphatase